ncbi:hypothetical protein OG292_14285 [Streptomyces sp. NBC_01511]|uniref:hypothetical protein n=1 Tax=unclassified Streptomyces TaxID=2593676 RepID=UPI00386472C6
MHSERSIGYPLLHNDKQKGLKKVDTVHHANDYDQSVSRHRRDAEHQDDMEELKSRHGR